MNSDVLKVLLGVGGTFLTLIALFTFRAVSAKLLIILLKQESAGLKEILHSLLIEQQRERDKKLDEARHMAQEAAAAAREALAVASDLRESVEQVESAVSEMGSALGSIPDVSRVIDKFEKTLSVWTDKIESVVVAVARIDERQKTMTEQLKLHPIRR